MECDFCNTATTLTQFMKAVVVNCTDYSVLCRRSWFLLLCLVLLQVPKYFVPIKIFWASPKIWLHLVPLQKLLCRHKKQFYWMQIIFLSGTKCLWLPQYVNNFLVWHKNLGPAQNILGPVKGQVINLLLISFCFHPNRKPRFSCMAKIIFWCVWRYYANHLWTRPKETCGGNRLQKGKYVTSHGL